MTFGGDMGRSSLLFVRYLALSFAFLAIVGCREVKVKNGEVPPKYVPMAMKFMGTYQGQFDGVPATLNLVMNGNKVVVEYADRESRDILGPQCDSRVGNLLAVKVDEVGTDRYELKRVRFALNPNRCKHEIEGRELVMEVRRKDSRVDLSLSILGQLTWEERCRIEPGNPAAGIPPKRVCEREPVQQFLTGKFRKN